MDGTAATRRDRIRELEAASRTLEPGPERRARVREAVADYSERFLRSLEELDAYRADKSPTRELRDHPVPEQGRSVEEILGLLARAVDEPGLNPASGGHLAYIPGGGLYAAALGDYLAAVTNRYAGVHFTGPGAVEMENLLLDWMADLVGYPESAGGNLASGGSIANLIAVVTARDARELEPAEYERAVVYLTGQTHHCLDKALRIAGMRPCVRRRVPTDERYRMRPDALQEAVRRDRERGLRPWMVMASAGTTDVGAVDPLEPIGDVASDQDLWFHVDAAYGGFFVLCDSGPPELAGMSRSDSVVLDPHKSLFLPYGSGAVLVRDKRDLYRSHHYQADYMQDIQEAEAAEIKSPADLSPELSKHFRGPRLWLPLQLHGIAPFRAALEEKLHLARHFYREIQQLGFEVGPQPQLSVVAFRWVPREGDPDAFNRALMEKIQKDGRVFLSSTRLDGKFVLRLAVLAFRTHLETVELAAEVLREKVEALEREGGW